MCENYFTNIDTIEKAYILGLMNKNNNYIMVLLHSPYILSILQKFCFNIQQTFTILVEDETTLNSIKEATYKFNTYSRELKIAFIRGVFESNYEKIPINDYLKPILNDMLEFINIKHDIIDSNIVYKNELNNVKFYKLIYDNNDITLLNSFVKEGILHKII